MSGHLYATHPKPVAFLELPNVPQLVFLAGSPPPPPPPLPQVLHVRSISSWAPVCIGPYCQANTLGPGGGIALIAGQIGLQPASMTFPGRSSPASSACGCGPSTPKVSKLRCAGGGCGRCQLFFWYSLRGRWVADSSGSCSGMKVLDFAACDHLVRK